jgi:hypothetical protein
MDSRIRGNDFKAVNISGGWYNRAILNAGQPASMRCAFTAVSKKQ